jgi:magnesium transporter
VACSSLLAIAFASVIGSSLPIVFRRLNVDPAIATGPFVTTLVDILGILIYFNVARWLIHS